MFFATTTFIFAYFVCAAVGENYIECLSSYGRFFFPEDILIIRCIVTAKLKRFSIYDVDLLFNNRSWEFSIAYTDDVVQDEFLFNIPRESITSEHTTWSPKEPWKVYSNVKHSTDEIVEFQGILFDDLTEPILQWHLGTPVNNIQLQDNSSILLTQSTCALDVVIIVPHVNAGSPIYFGVTKSAFADGNVQWSSLVSPCPNCQLLDVVLANHYLLILMGNKVFLSNFLLDKGETSNNEVSFTEVFDIPNCMSVKKGQLIYTPQCRYHVDDDFQDDTIVVLYQCEITSSESVTNVYMSSSATNFSNWTAVGDFLTSSHSWLAVAFNPQTDNLILLNTVTSKTIAEVHHVAKNLSVQVSTVYRNSFQFPADSHLKGLFIHPISNFLYAYGKQVWLSTDDGLSFDPLISPVESDEIKVCRSGYSDGSIACVTASNTILYSKGSPGRFWNVDSQGLFSGIELAIFFDYLENLYVCSVKNGQVKSVNVDIIGGILKGNLSLSNPLMIQILSDKDIHFYEYPLSANAFTSFSEFSLGMLLKSSNGGSIIIKDLQLMDDSPASRGFLVTLHTLVVERLIEAKSTALAVAITLSNWNENTHECELELESGSWPADDLWKTIVVRNTASFLVKEVTGAHAKVISLTNIQNLTKVASGSWTMFDFRAGSWVLMEDKCRHSLQSTLGVSKDYSVVDVDLRMNTTIEVSLGLSAPFEVGSDLFLYGYLTNPSIFRPNFSPSFSISPLQEKLFVDIIPVINRKTVTTLRVFAAGASMLCPKTHLLITIYGACPSERVLTFNYPDNFSRESFLPSTAFQKDTMVDLKPNYRPPSHLGYSIPTSNNIYYADPGVPRKREDFKISQETGRLKQCATARTRQECGCTDRMMMTDEARYSDCKMRAFRLLQPAILETNFSMEVYGETVAIPDNYLFRIFDVNNRSVRVQYKKGASAGKFVTALRQDKRFAKMANEHFEPNSIEIVMEGSGLYHLRAEIMPGLSFCPLYSEFQIYVITTQLQYPVPYVLNFVVALVLGGILFILAIWCITTHAPAIKYKRRDHNMKNVEPLHPPHSLRAVSLSMGDRNRQSLKGEQTSSTELLESAQAQDLLNENAVTGPQHEHKA